MIRVLGFRRLALLLVLTMSACGRSADVGGDGADGSDDKVHFIVLGDTGSGVDGPQSQVASLMQQVCEMRGCDFATIAGDNIYERGASDVDDPLFDTAFEQPYAAFDFPFLMTLGNHDNTGSTIAGDGAGNSTGDVEVAYHYAEHGSGKWYLPSRYYSLSWPVGSSDPVLELFSLDSSPITHFVDDIDSQWRGGALDQYIADQTVFVQDALAASKARWKFALAHHPYISNGQHGNAGDYERGALPNTCAIPLITSQSCRGEDYKAFLENTICDQVDVFFNGHDHELYWLKPTAACGKTQHILSGAGGKEREILEPGRNPGYFELGEHYGFFWIELDGDRFTGAVYTLDLDGNSVEIDADGNPAPVFEMSFERGQTPA